MPKVREKAPSEVAPPGMPAFVHDIWLMVDDAHATVIANARAASKAPRREHLRRDRGPATEEGKAALAECGVSSTDSNRGTALARVVAAAAAVQRLWDRDRYDEAAIFVMRSHARDDDQLARSLAYALSTLLAEEHHLAPTPRSLGLSRLAGQLLEAIANPQSARALAEGKRRGSKAALLLWLRASCEAVIREAEAAQRKGLLPPPELEIHAPKLSTKALCVAMALRYLNASHLPWTPGVVSTGGALKRPPPDHRGSWSIVWAESIYRRLPTAADAEIGDAPDEVRASNLARFVLRTLGWPDDEIERLFSTSRKKKYRKRKRAASRA